MSHNPLSVYFRGADVHQMLPTRGQFFDAGEIDLAINGEVAILPMTAADEIILKNPDALLNGDALERLFRSCIPAMDVLLLGIKLASFGDSLEINTTCPECGHQATMETSIRGLLNEITMVRDEDTMVRLNDEMVVYLRPYDFEAKTKLDLAAFEEAKLLQHLLTLEASDEDKTRLFNESWSKIAELNLDLLSHCIRSISIPGQEVRDPQHIREFIGNSHKNVARDINARLKSLSGSGVNRRLEVQCAKESCQHQWETEMTFDPAHFFA
jgi:hypothetical protein